MRACTIGARAARKETTRTERGRERYRETKNQAASLRETETERQRDRESTKLREQRRVWRELREQRPFCVVMCPPCGPFSRLRNLMPDAAVGPERARKLWEASRWRGLVVHIQRQQKYIHLPNKYMRRRKKYIRTERSVSCQETLCRLMCTCT